MISKFFSKEKIVFELAEKVMVTKDRVFSKRNYSVIKVKLETSVQRRTSSSGC